jgi:molecular chaperone GrpE
MKDHDEDVIIEDDSESERGDSALKKLREKLKKCEREKQEYLNGWQRARADFANAQKRFDEELKNAKDRGVNDAVEKLLTVLDSFDHALSQNGLDEKTQKGVEMIHKQLLTLLSSYGVTSFNPTGEVFDPMKHEAIGHDEGGEEGVVSLVVRTGYERNGMVIRPATVRVFGS